MRRLVPLLALAMVVLLPACNLLPADQPTPSITATPPAAATPTRETASPTPASERRCGDSICDGPETAQNCPQDCGDEAPPTTVPAPSPAPTAADGPADAGPLPPVYVTVAGHIEDVPLYARCGAYPDFREALLLWADAVAAYDAAVNLQIEYEFLLGASRCETPELRQSTDGKNVIQYLIDRYGFEIDPHQEGGWEEGADNYADIRHLAGELTTDVSENVGGFVWDDAEQLARLSHGESGWIHTDFTWQPEILTLAVSRQHHLGDFSADDVASGIWRPKGADEQFWTHDSEASLIYVGPGERTNWDDARPNKSTPDFVRTIAHGLEDGTLDPDLMYTASIPVPQSIILHPERHHELTARLQELDPIVAADQARYATYSEAVEIWRRDYGARPNIFIRDEVTHPLEVKAARVTSP